MQVLDCTIRDGGYYVDWDFDEVLVDKYLLAIATSKVDIVEIGFRFLPQERFLGAFAYCTDEFLNTLNLPNDLLIAVMVNADQLINYEKGVEAAINLLFKSAADSPVRIVRVAMKAEDVCFVKLIAKSLYDLGYKVFINLMQIDLLEKTEIIEIAQTVRDWGVVEVLYFADSFGSMEVRDITGVIATLSGIWDKDLGIHAHDNKGLALVNCLSAIENGVNYIDATLLGMGRGAGNARIENLLIEITQRGIGDYYPDALFPLVTNEFQDLKDNHNWGGNIFYFLSAVHRIHPTYVQKLLSEGRYSTEQILAAIRYLKLNGNSVFSLDSMMRSLSGIEGSEEGGWSVDKWLKEKNVLIIGSGPGTKKYLKAILRFIRNKKPFVLCLNTNSVLPQEVVNAYVACNEMRILMELNHYSKLKKPLIIPVSRIPDSCREALSHTEILDYGLRVAMDDFSIGKNGCVLSSSLALGYAISIATAGKARKILCVGMDGYGYSDPRNDEIINLLKHYKSLSCSIPIVSLTPTSYPIDQKSLFEPGL